MSTLIIPCAGKSTRYPGMRPKWMLTHPDGELMIKKVVYGLDYANFDRIIITIVKEHDEKYDAELILRSIFNNLDIEICILPEFTQSASETVFKTIEMMHVNGPFVVKDSDNYVKVDLNNVSFNALVGYNLKDHPNVPNIPAKSFIISNRQNIIEDIIEKEIVSNIICLGVYIFSSTDEFITAYKNLININREGEFYISHIVSYMIGSMGIPFSLIFAEDYQDWGTMSEWVIVQKQFRSFFVDVDGILLKNCGKYGRKNWENSKEVIEDNMLAIKKLQDNGAQIIITTSRPEENKPFLMQIFEQYGIKPHAWVMSLNHSPRVIINDFANTLPYPSCHAISIPRNSSLVDYLK